jgi:hypothetical protein
MQDTPNRGVFFRTDMQENSNPNPAVSEILIRAPTQIIKDFISPPLLKCVSTQGTEFSVHYYNQHISFSYELIKV